MERLDDILGYDSLKIYQNSDFFSFSLDSIILANYATIRHRDRKIVDFCSGNGVIPIILSQRTKNHIIGVEIQKNLVDLANKSILENNLESQIDIVLDDIINYSQLHLNEFDLVLCNPPYFKVEKNSTFNESYEKKIARHEILINLSDLCCCAKKVLKDNGTFCMVHRTDRLMDILEEFRKNNLEPKRIKFIHETVAKNSTLILIEAQKNGKPGLIVDKPLIQYYTDGTMTDEYSKLQKEVFR